MAENKFSFGSASRMKEVPVGEYAELKFSGIMKVVDTDWGEKCSFEVTLYPVSYTHLTLPTKRIV